ncbi:M23 family metallopeptidase [Phycicoccus flavus]|uniref:M23 family metallopeptidase n=1 Tax=Phycicoccus flavus TaxID=2502783 RepID=UPI000FEBA869|nr:M23 family metallopeptidase [Phycicoccus flavus]NHA68523.1 M23 family metallopeptidase [Phycicoccus flavus]
MTSRSYQGRHYSGRHRNGSRGPRLPRALSAGFVLPTTAAAALVVTATGAATVAQQSGAESTIALTGQQTAMARVQEAADTSASTDIAVRRQDASMQTAALQGRAEAQQRAARAAKRKAAAEAQARAEAERKARAAAREAERQAKKWVRPVGIWNLTSGFGWRWGKQHDGIDLAAPTGTPLYAMSQGTVTQAGWEGEFGYKVEIQYWDGSVSWYGHMSRIDVVAGQTVLPGSQVGLVGNTGHSFGSHLHFEIQTSAVGDNPVDPVPWLQTHGLW